MLVAHGEPARLAEALGGFVAVVGHERVELLDVAQQRGEGAVGQRPSPVAAAVLAAPAQLAEEVQREDAHLGGAGGQARLVDAALGEEAAEQRERVEARPDGRPAQRAGLQADLAVPLQAVAQPGLFDREEVIAGVHPYRLVLTQRDPAVELGVPEVVLPPLARVVGDREVLIAAAQRRPLVDREREAALAPGARQAPLALPLAQRELHQRLRRGPARRPAVVEHLPKPPDELAVVAVESQALLDQPPERVGELALHRPGQAPQVELEPLRMLRAPAKRRVARQVMRGEVRAAQLGGDPCPQLEVARRPEVVAAVELIELRVACDQHALTRQRSVIAFQSAMVRCSASSLTHP